jgi:hypothetical protein
VASAPQTEFNAQIAANQPDGTTILITQDDGSVWIVLPEAGNLWVAYEWAQEPAASIKIWHQGGTTTPIEPGFNTYQVGASDAITYTLNAAGDMIKLGWAYV